MITLAIYDEPIRQATPAPRPRWLRWADHLLDTALALMALVVFALASARWGVLPVYLLVSPVALLALALLCAHQRLRLAEAMRAAISASNSAQRAAEQARQAAADAAAAALVAQGVGERSQSLSSSRWW